MDAQDPPREVLPRRPLEKERGGRGRGPGEGRERPLSTPIRQPERALGEANPPGVPQGTPGGTGVKVCGRHLQSRNLDEFKGVF